MRQEKVSPTLDYPSNSSFAIVSPIKFEIFELHIGRAFFTSADLAKHTHMDRTSYVPNPARDPMNFTKW